MSKTTIYDKTRLRRRNNIIKESKKYFVMNGLINDTNMKDIAHWSKISRQTLYKYYKNIDEVILAVHDDVITKAIKYLKKSYIKENDYLANVHLAIKLLFAYSRDKKDDAIFLTLFYAYSKNRNNIDIINNDYSRLINEIPDMFNSFDEYDTSIRHDLDPNVSRLVIINCIYSNIQSLLLSEKSNIELDYNKVISEVTTMIERYLKSLN